MENVKIVPAKNGRWAVLARNGPSADWRQVESIDTEENAQRYAEEIDNDASLRGEYINDAEGDDWGEDAPQ